jgi:hypothetical protein
VTCTALTRRAGRRRRKRWPGSDEPRELAENLAAAYNSAGITKAAGGAAVTADFFMPCAEAFCDAIGDMGTQIKRQGKAIKRTQKAIKALSRPPPVPKPRMVDYKPEEWRTTLTPAAGRPAYGHDFGLEKGDGHQPPGWHPDTPER